MNLTEQLKYSVWFEPYRLAITNKFSKQKFDVIEKKSVLEPNWFFNEMFNCEICIGQFTSYLFYLIGSLILLDFKFFFIGFLLAVPHGILNKLIYYIVKLIS